MISGGMSPFLQPNTKFLCTKLKVKMTEIAQEPNSRKGKMSNSGGGGLPHPWWQPWDDCGSHHVQVVVVAITAAHFCFSNAAF